MVKIPQSQKQIHHRFIMHQPNRNQKQTQNQKHPCLEMERPTIPATNTSQPNRKQNQTRIQKHWCLGTGRPTIATIECQAFISELHWCSLLQLLLLQNMLEQLVFSSLIPSILSWSVDADRERWGDSSRVSMSRGSQGHGSSLHVHNGTATEGNGLHVTGQKRSEETEATRFFRISVVEVGGVERSASRGWSMHGVQRLRDRWNLISFAGNPGSLAKEVMPWRHRGHGMDPGGVSNSEEILLAEQR